MQKPTLKQRRPKSKYLLLTEELKGEIISGRYAIGAKLPSVATLARQYGVSTATAHRCIRHLAAERLVSCHSDPRGTIVLRAEQPLHTFRKTTLACLLRPFIPKRNAIDNFGLDIIQGIQDEASARRFRLLIHNLRDPNCEEQIRQVLQEGWAAGLILDQRTPLALVRKLSQFGVPAVMFNRTEYVEGLSVVTPDYIQIGAETARLLKERGYERFAYCPADVHGEDWQEDATPQRDRCLGFFSALAEMGVPEREVLLISYPDPPHDQTPTPEQIGLPRRKPADWRRLGIFLRSDRHAAPLLHALEQTDLVLGRDVGLIGASDLEINRFSPHPFSTWDVDPYRMGRQTVIELIHRIEHPDAPRTVVKLGARFVDRGTA